MTGVAVSPSVLTQIRLLVEDLLEVRGGTVAPLSALEGVEVSASEWERIRLLLVDLLEVW
jgi:hypothetical protein